MYVRDKPFSLIETVEWHIDFREYKKLEHAYSSVWYHAKQNCHKKIKDTEDRSTSTHKN